jgi:transposase
VPVGVLPVERGRSSRRQAVRKLRDWAYAQRATPGSSLRTAIEYVPLLWPGLTVFLDDEAVPIDNRRAEQGMRGPVLGRASHCGSRSLRATRVAAPVYGLIETAKLCGLDPRDYLLAATQAQRLDGRVPVLHELPA